MNRAEIAALLNRFQDAFPQSMPPRPGTIEEWSSSAAGGISAADAFATFDLWRDENDRPPTIAQFCEANTARRMYEANRAARERGLTETAEQAPLPGTDAHTEQLRFLAAAKQVLTPVPGVIDHDHHRGAENCPKCGPRLERQEQ